MAFGSKKNPCYFCDICDICGHFGALLAFIFSQVLIFITFFILVIFAIFVTNGFCQQGKSLLLLPYLRYLRTFRGPSCLHLLLSLDFCYIFYSCDFCDICNQWFLLARKILVTFAIFAIFADIPGPFLP